MTSPTDETTDRRRPRPQLDLDTEFFWTMGSDGVLRFVRCNQCGLYLHPPRPVCRRCLSTDVAPSPVSGRAKVLSFTVNVHPYWPQFPPPYVIALVEFPEQENFRMITNIVNCDPEDVSTGMDVEVVFEPLDELWLPLFQPIGAQA